MNTENILNGI